MPIQVILDDSGGKGQGPVFVIAGLIGRAEQWAAFSDQWAAELARSPSVRWFKMREAAMYEGEFRGFKTDQRDAKVRDLARILNSFGFQVIHVTLETTSADILERNPKPFSTLYGQAFNIAIMAACYELLERGETERFEIIFDEHPALGPKIKEWYPLLRWAMEPAAQAILPIDPLFRDDKGFMPLQAADMMAWLCRRDTSGEPHSFGWLAAELANTTVSENSQYVDLRRMKGIIRESDKVERNVSPLVVAEIKKLLGR